MAATKTPYKRGKTSKERFMTHVEFRENGCWEWTSVKASDGRGLFRITPRKWLKAHLSAFELFVGPRQRDKEAHHICLDGTCVNPFHLDFLTHAEHSALHAKLRREAASE